VFCLTRTSDWVNLCGPLSAVHVPVVGAEVVDGPGEGLGLKVGLNGVD